jgi:phosphohistidine swiveling domain-containing protein
LRVQWKLEKFIHSLKEELPATDAAKIEESVALGLAVQILMMRLPSADPKDLGIWLALPDQAPRAARATLERIDKLVRRRNLLSPAWKSVFPRQTAAEAAEGPAPAAISKAKDWKGIPIVAGKVRGTFVLIDPLRMPKDIELPQGPLILCFTKARPESVEFFPRAQAVAFAEGGAVAHACSIARERNLPCVSGLGPDFAAAIKSWSASGETVELTLDGAEGSVSLKIP